MCFSFNNVINPTKLNSDFDLNIKDSEVFEERIYPKTSALVLKYDVSIEVDQMTYSLTPSWSKTKTVKWPTYNARLNRTNTKTGSFEKIYEAPTWREPFTHTHCVIPFDSFYEICRKGEAKGFEVNFKPSGESLLYAAGIYSTWKDPNKQTTHDSFAMITTDPTEYIEKIGHERSPLFLDPESALLWIRNEFLDKESAYEFLESNQIRPEFTYEKVRKLKS